MNNKGQMNTITRALVSLVIIFIIAGIPGYSFANEKIFGGKGIIKYVKDKFEDKPPETFIPWTGPELTVKEQVVDNSIRALRCAMNSAVGGYVDPEGCEGGTHKDNKMIFGDKEVTCELGQNTNPFCRVKNFELPQTIGQPRNIIEWAKSWISSAEDPKYLLYHESFPQGEDAPWMISEWSFWKDVVIMGGVVNAGAALLFHTGKAVKGLKAMSEISENAVEKGLKTTAKEFGEKTARELTPGTAIILGNLFTREGYERIIKSQILYKELLENGIPESAAKELSEEALEKISYYARIKHPQPVQKFLTDDFPQVMNRVSPGLTSEAADAVRKINLPTTLRNIYESKLTKEAIQEIEDVGKLKSFITKNIFKEGTEEINKEVFEKLIRTGASEEISKAIGKEAEERLASRTLEYFSYLTGETGTAKYFTTILGRNTKQALESQVDELAKRVTLDSDIASKLLLGKTTKELDEIFKFATSKEGLKQIMKSTPVQGRWIKIQIKDLITGKAYAKIPASVFWSAGASLWQTGKLTGKTGMQLWNSRITKYALLYKIGEGIARTDANNNKYESKGNNNLALSMPFDFESNTKYELDEPLKMYPVNLKKDDGYSRFYTASPCKSNIKVTKKICSCEIETGDYVWKDKNYQVPLDKTGTTITGTPSSTYYSFSHYPEGIKQEKIKACKGNSFYSKECKKSLISHPVIYEKFLKFLYADFYSPTIDYFNNYNIEKLGGLTSREPEPPTSNQKMHYYYEIFRKYKFTLLSWEMSTARVGQLLEGIPGGPLFQNVLFEPIKLPNVRFEFVKTIKNKISFEEFKRKFEEISYKEFAQEITSAKWNSFTNLLLEIELNKKREVTEDSFLYAAAGNASFQYNIVEENALDLNHIVKNCKSPNLKETTRNLLLKDDERTARITTQCLVVEHEEINENEFNGYNYCYSSDHATSKFLKSAVWWSAIAIDLAIGVWFPPAEIPAAALTGAGSAWALKKLDEKMYWPQR